MGVTHGYKPTDSKIISGLNGSWANVNSVTIGLIALDPDEVLPSIVSCRLFIPFCKKQNRYARRSFHLFPIQRWNPYQLSLHPKDINCFDNFFTTLKAAGQDRTDQVGCLHLQQLSNTKRKQRTESPLFLPTLLRNVSTGSPSLWPVASWMPM